jgi:hypothetical protein
MDQSVVLWKAPKQVINAELHHASWEGKKLTCVVLCHMDDGSIKSMEIVFFQVSRGAIEYSNYGDLHRGSWMTMGPLYVLFTETASQSARTSLEAFGTVLLLYLENAAIAVSCGSHSVSEIA